MSKESWLAEFYPVAAEHVPPEGAVAHSLQKWKGFTEKSLIKHNITDPGVTSSGSTCALCYHYAEGVNKVECSGCPIVLHTGATCDCMDTMDTVPISVWNSYRHYGDPQPMINLLQTLKDKEDGNKKLGS